MKNDHFVYLPAIYKGKPLDPRSPETAARYERQIAALNEPDKGNIVSDSGVYGIHLPALMRVQAA